MNHNLPAVTAPIAELERMATSIVKSRLFGVDSIDQAVTLMLVAQAEGLHPATACRDYHVIKGRPALKADAMLARFQQAGGKVEWESYTDAKVSGNFSHPQSPKPVLIEWTIEMARKIGLAGKDNWKNYPRAMLRARVISEGVRTCYPAIASGIYTPEEVQDFAPEKDITPTAGYLASLPAPRQEVMHETATEVRALWANDQAQDAYALIENSGFDAEEMIALWSLLPSDIRSAHKRMKAAETATEKGTISPAKHKRIEALIKEQGLDRNGLKNWCLGQFEVDSFPKLNDEQYKRLDDHIAEIIGLQKAAPPPITVAAQGQPSPTEQGDTRTDGAAPDAQYINAAQRKELQDYCKEKGVLIERVLTKVKVFGIDEIPAGMFGRCIAFIDAASAKKG